MFKMFLRANIKYKLLLLFLVSGSYLYAQKSIYYKERVLLGSVGITKGRNTSFLQNIQDSLLFTVKGTADLTKGDFVNYFEPNQSYRLQAATDSYNRLSERLVVYGLARYSFHKGKNVRGSSFLNPYQVPFNFVERDEKVKGDRRIETYQLIGGLSYKLSERFCIGGRINYQTVNFAKLKDIRNLNRVLGFKADLGLSYQLSGQNFVGISYRHKRYIEGLKLLQEGDSQKDYYALINRGSFMGLLHLYGEDGILEIRSEKPWVANAHNIATQYIHHFSRKFRIFSELSFENEKGHFGNEGNLSVTYFKHNRTTYRGLLKLVKQDNYFSHIAVCKFAYEDLSNKEQLYKERTTAGGRTTVNYYGENEILKRKQSFFILKYDFLWGNNYLQAPWHIDFEYQYLNRKSTTSYFPYFRKQNIKLHYADLGIERLFHSEKMDFSVRLASGFSFGNGGSPKDGMYIATSGSTNKPDYLDEFLYKEKEYLTAKRLLPECKLRAERAYGNIRGFVEFHFTYTIPFDLEYLSGDYISTTFTIGVAL